MYFDAEKLIVQKDGDSGDTAGREGDYFTAKFLYIHLNLVLPYRFERELNFNQVLSKLQTKPGVFVRSPYHYNDPKDFSRDQTTPLIIAMGMSKNYKVLRKLAFNQVKNYGRFQNGDIPSPADFGNYVRALHYQSLYPILVLGDIFILAESLIRIFSGTDNNTSDDINHTISLLQSQYVMPTPISWLARKIYVKFRRGGVQKAWDNYFKEFSGANPFNEIYRPLISRM